MSKLIKILCICVCLVFIKNGITQSEFVVRYYEKQAVSYNHHYTFIKQDSNSTEGKFTHHFSPDHEGESVGKGKFFETQRFFILKYSPPFFKDTLIYTYNPLHPDSIFIKWVNLWGEVQDDFLTVVVFDSLTNKSFYHSNFVSYPWAAKIPYVSSGFNKKRITIKGMFIQELELKIPDGMNEITLVMNKRFESIIYHEKKVKLRKLDKGNCLKGKNRKLFTKERL